MASAYDKAARRLAVQRGNAAGGGIYLQPVEYKSAKFSAHSYPLSTVGGSILSGSDAASADHDVKTYHAQAKALLVDQHHPLREKHGKILGVVGLTKRGNSKPGAVKVLVVPIPGSAVAKRASRSVAGSLGFTVKTSTGTIVVGAPKSRGVLSANGSKAIDADALAALKALVEYLVPTGSLPAKLKVVGKVHKLAHLSKLKQVAGDNLAAFQATSQGAVGIRQRLVDVGPRRSGSPGVGARYNAEGKAALKEHARLPRSARSKYECAAQYNDPTRPTSSADYAGRGYLSRSSGLCTGGPAMTPLAGSTQSYAARNGAFRTDAVRAKVAQQLAAKKNLTSPKYNAAIEWSGLRSATDVQRSPADMADAVGRVGLGALTGGRYRYGPY